MHFALGVFINYDFSLRFVDADENSVDGGFAGRPPENNNNCLMQRDLETRSSCHSTSIVTSINTTSNQQTDYKTS